MYKYENKNGKHLVTGTNYKSYFNEKVGALDFIDLANKQLLDELKLEKIKALHVKADEAYQEYISNYPKAEVESFDTKAKEALAWEMDNSTATPFIDRLALQAGEDRVAYINDILVKVHYQADSEGAMIATRDAIKACTTQEELEAIQI